MNMLYILAVFMFACAGCTHGGEVQLSVRPEPVSSAQETRIVETEEYHIPIDIFYDGVRLKPFGIYIDPATSPVQPERFTGYHTGVDVEVPEEMLEEDMWVYAVTDGVVKDARKVSGYGGAIAIEHEIEGETYIGIYGHLRASSFLVQSGDTVSRGQKIAVLGTGYTAETDNERKHLHFALRKGTRIDWRGYVAKKDDLNLWADPEMIFSESAAVQ